jgi:hypothetical protein
MTWLKMVSLVLFALALACGQILFKAAAQAIKTPVGFDVLVSNPYFLVGIAVYGLAALYWVLLLRKAAR